VLTLCHPKYWSFPLETTEQRNWHIRALRVPYRYNRSTIEENKLRRIYDYNVPERALKQKWDAVYNINTARCYLYTPAGWIEHNGFNIPALYRSVEPYFQTTTVVWYLVASGLWVRHKNLPGFYTWHVDAPPDLTGMFHHEGGFTHLCAEYLAVRVGLPTDFAHGLIVYLLRDGTVLVPPYASIVWNLRDIPSAPSRGEYRGALSSSPAPPGTTIYLSSTPSAHREK
jgi:hypothetical protein